MRRVPSEGRGAEPIVGGDGRAGSYRRLRTPDLGGRDGRVANLASPGHVRPLAAADQGDRGTRGHARAERSRDRAHLGRAPLRGTRRRGRHQARTGHHRDLLLRPRGRGSEGAGPRRPRADAGRPRAHLRALRDRARQPPGPRGRAGCGRAPGRGLQPALPPWPAGPRQDAPPGRDRRVPRARPSSAHRPHDDRRAVHQRVRRRAPPRRAGALQAALPRTSTPC